jgi:hypothetical protein
MKDKTVCPIHGGKSKAGAQHPSYRHGQRSKVLARVLSILNKEQRRPVMVDVRIVSDESWQTHGISAPFSAVALPIMDDGVTTTQEALIFLKMAERELRRKIRLVQAELDAEAPDDGQQT